MSLIRSHNRSKEFAALRISVHSGDVGSRCTLSFLRLLGNSRAYARENKKNKNKNILMVTNN